VFVLDPAPAPAGTSDAPMEVSRRVRSLLEASGATVVTTRSSIDTGTAETERANRAKIANPTAVVGLSVGEGAPGMAVLRPSNGEPTKIAESTQLQSLLVKKLAEAGYPARASAQAKDPVLDATGAASVRLVLGSATSKDDVAAFRNPKWADAVSRAVYVTLGEKYGGS